MIIVLSRPRVAACVWMMRRTLASTPISERDWLSAVARRTRSRVLGRRRIHCGLSDTSFSRIDGFPYAPAARKRASRLSSAAERYGPES